MVLVVPELRRLRPFAAWSVGALAAIKLALHFWVNATTPYGFHRDELLYLAMGRHLQLWRMDFPPGIAAVAEATRALLGDSLVAIRSVPALVGTALLVAAALFARELGGGRRAQVLAALAVLASPLFLRSANLFQPVVLDQATWTAALFAMARLSWQRDARWWIALGAALGVGLLVKFSIAFIGIGIVLAILLTPLRASLRTIWPWLALLLALAIGSPSLVGQYALGFPVLQQMEDLREVQLERVTPARIPAGPALPGVRARCSAPRASSRSWPAKQLSRYRAIGWSCAGAFAVLLLLQGKPYYLGPVYPALLGAGRRVGGAELAALGRRHGHPRLRRGAAADRSADPATRQDGGLHPDRWPHRRTSHQYR